MADGTDPSWPWAGGGMGEMGDGDEGRLLGISLRILFYFFLI